jgi:F0F1-type ATP synthase assembly protein I
MSANPIAVAARKSLQLLVWQLACIVLASVVTGIAAGVRPGASVLVGGGIGLVWTAYMAFTLVKHSVDFGARLSAASFFKGWLFKIAMTAALLVIALRAEGLLPPAVLGGLFAAMAAYWVWFAFGLDRRWSRARG